MNRIYNLLYVFKIHMLILVILRSAIRVSLKSVKQIKIKFHQTFFGFMLRIAKTMRNQLFHDCLVNMRWVIK